MEGRRQRCGGDARRGEARRCAALLSSHERVPGLMCDWRGDMHADAECGMRDAVWAGLVSSGLSRGTYEEGLV